MYIAIGMGALGALLGVWVAWSQSAVVMTALPLIFGVFGGAGGYSLLKLDLTKPANLLKVRMLSTAMASLCLACLVSLALALVLRPTLLTALNGPTVDVSVTQAPLRALTMRARLAALGASPSEIAGILGSTTHDGTDAQASIENVRSGIRSYVAAYDALPQSDRTILENQGFLGEDSRELYVGAKLLQLELEALIAQGEVSSQRLAALISDRFAATVARSNPREPSDDVQVVLLSNPAFVAERIRLFVMLSDVSGLPFMAGADIGAADKLIEVLSGAVEPKGLASVIAGGPGRPNF